MTREKITLIIYRSEHGNIGPVGTETKRMAVEYTVKVVILYTVKVVIFINCKGGYFYIL